MSEYRFEFRSGGKTVFAADHEFDDDLDALDVASELSDDFEVRITRDNLFVAVVKRGDQNSTPLDKRPG